LFVAGALLPGGGYSQIDNAARHADDAARHLDDVARRPPCGCFSEDTQVLTEDGSKSIQDIKIGDKLVSRDENDGAQGVSEVQELHIYHGRELFGLVTEATNGARTELTLTDDHPVWVFDKGWTKSRDLAIGDYVSDVSGERHRVIEFASRGHKGKTFNFTVSNDSTYAVGSGGIWVHNGGPCDIKTYQTYTKTNPQTGDVYSGRTSGAGTPEENIAARDRSHHMNDQGYGPAQLDQSSANKDAIRGREQNLIDHHGGAQSQGGTSGNAINGVSPTNPNRQDYLDAAEREFGGGGG
jgi:Pretoxin HINT domain